jgi:hypothetical protein
MFEGEMDFERGLRPLSLKNSPLQPGKTLFILQWFWLERGKACPPHEASEGGGEVRSNNQMQTEPFRPTPE